MPAAYYPTWRETLPIQCQPVPGVALQPDPDPTAEVYPLQVDAQAALTALLATGVTAGYYGIYQTYTDGRFRLWPNNLQPSPGKRVA